MLPPPPNSAASSASSATAVGAATAAADFTPAPLTGLFCGENVWSSLKVVTSMSWLQSSVGYGLTSPSLSAAARYSIARLVSTAAVRTLAECRRRAGNGAAPTSSPAPAQVATGFLERLLSARVVALVKQRFQDSHFSIAYDTLRAGFGCGMPLAFNAAAGDPFDGGDVAREVVLWGAGNTAPVDAHARCSVASVLSELSHQSRLFVNGRPETLATLLDLFRGYESGAKRLPPGKSQLAKECKKLFGSLKKPEESSADVQSQPKWTRLLDVVALLTVSMAPPRSADEAYPIPPLPMTIVAQKTPISPQRRACAPSRCGVTRIAEPHALRRPPPQPQQTPPFSRRRRTTGG